MPSERRMLALRDVARACGDLLHGIEGDSSVRIHGLAYDSREVADGDLFFCVPGALRDGHDFAAGAVAAGAAALCVQRDLGLDVAQIIVGDPRRAMGRIASAFFGHPGDDLVLLGVTGTNGKTTTAFLLESILAASGRVTGLIGTIETRVAGQRRPGARTTPDSIDLQRLLAEMRAAGVSAVAMEVTSHALVLHRVEGLRFEAAAFTNLSQDHLDFHVGMEDYFAAKTSLFTIERCRGGAVNVDDPYGRRIAEIAPVPVIGFGEGRGAVVRAVEVSPRAAGTGLVVTTPKGEIRAVTSLVGRFNVSNCLAAASCALQAGIDIPDIERGLEALRSVPGRFEVIDAGQPFTVVVDYAHSPDSLDNVLRHARRMTARGGRVLCVFGCGGDRDRAKRPLMGAVVASLADVVVVTSDNPRSEDPRAIVAEILEGVVAERAGGADEVTLDRGDAIASAIESSRPGDVLVIAGKGHETGQQIGDVTVPFDDRDVARSALAAHGWRKTG